MKIQEFAKHLDEPKEIGKKKKRLSSSEMKKIKSKAFEVYKEDWSQKYKTYTYTPTEAAKKMVDTGH